MNDRSKESQLLLGLLAILMLVTSVVPFAQQIPPASSNSSEGQIESSEPQDSFIASYITHDPITITSNADFTSQGFPGSGTPEVPYVIAGYNITTTGVCISIQNTDAYFVIRDCLLSGGSSGDGIRLHSVTHGEIRNNTINQKENGVWLEFSSDNTVVNNTISGNDHGVSLYSSSDNSLSSNIFVNNGIDISGEAVEYWRHSITADNLVNGKLLGYFWNLTSGIIDGIQYGQVILANCTAVIVEDGVFSNLTVGIELGYSAYCSLMNNTISGNEEGVSVASSSNNTVLNNTISGNNYGVYLHPSSDNNLIYLNIIADNNNGNARDYGTGNHWNSTVTGNYWSDYTGTGVYHVPGSAGSIDYYPFVYPRETTPPTIDHPADMDFEEGTTGNTIEWNPSDAHPSHHVVYRNGTEVVFDSWDGGSITVEVDGLSVGVYNYTIVVYDTSGNCASDTVFVIVPPQTTTTTTTTTTHGEPGAFDYTTIIIMVSAGAVLIIIIIIIVKKRGG